MKLQMAHSFGKVGASEQGRRGREGWVRVPPICLVGPRVDEKKASAMKAAPEHLRKAGPVRAHSSKVKALKQTPDLQRPKLATVKAIEPARGINAPVASPEVLHPASQPVARASCHVKTRGLP